MSLGDDQRTFALLVAEFIVWIYQKGYEVTLGDAYRDPRVHGGYGENLGYGSHLSYHKKKLAIDLNLFEHQPPLEDLQYLTTTADHAPLGAKWKSMHPECSWGGDFKNPDANHYSFGEKRT